MVEEKLSALAGARNPVALKGLGRGFDRLVSLVKVLYGLPERDWIWECVTLLNVLRNATAHKIQPHIRQDSQVMMDRIDDLVGKYSGVPMPKKLLAKRNIVRIRWRLASLYSVLCRLEEA
jgi:hypothetical protein